MTGHQKDSADYESTPLERPEYITAIVHLYRGELARATSWRLRLDTTTNWAVLTTAGLLAFAFREGDNPHWPLLLGTLLIMLLMGYEARRFQMFDVWRSRVRKIEENFYGPILKRDPVSPQKEWGERVARDLFQPRYKMSFLQAVRARFVRNYWAIFTVLLLCWVVKVVIHPNNEGTWEAVRSNLGRAPPWWVPVGYVGLLLSGFVGLMLFVSAHPGSDDDFWHEGADDGKGHIPDA